MWGLGFLTLLLTYIGAIRIMMRSFESRNFRLLAVITALALPATLPFLHLISSAHRQFQSLCSAADRKIIYETRSVDNIYLGNSSMCEDGHEYLKKYNGIECEWAPKEDGKPGNDRGMFRYTKGGNWSTPQCTSGCLNKPYLAQEKACQMSCMNKVKIEEFSHPFHYDSEKHELIKGKLYAYESTLISEGKVMAKFRNYTYYPYGNTWAKILGASSGSAPTKECDAKAFAKNTDVFKPNAP